MKLLVALCLLAAPLGAQDCPVVADHTAEQARIVAALQASAGPVDAQPLMQALWETWTDAPDAKAQELLDRGMSQREGYDFLGARDTFDLLVEYCPDYAEGYNQRAFASFLRQDFHAALHDLDRALELVPNHIAAMSGRGLTLIGLGRDDEAQEALKAAVALNPWLSERSLIVAPPGTEL